MVVRVSGGEERNGDHKVPRSVRGERTKTSLADEIERRVDLREGKHV